MCEKQQVVIIGCMKLTMLAETFTIHRLNPDASIPEAALHSPFFAITRTGGELSMVLPASVEVKSDRSDPGWACFKVEGPLEFSLIGVLANLATALANAGIPIFAVSTYDTDYILVKREQARAATDALTSAGHQVRQAV